jgi:hypothetical protein
LASPESRARGRAWYVVLGAGKNATAAKGHARAPMPGCPLCNNPWMQSKLRLYRPTDATLRDRRFVNTIV